MRGFTLIELLVTLAIFALVAAIILASYPNFTSRLNLERAAQEVAFSVRQAQSFALAVREFGAGSGIFPGYGIHFDKASEKEFILYADSNNNKVYDAPLELVDRFRIQTSPKISNLCGGEKSQPPGTCGLDSLDITFLRPNPTITLKSGLATYSDVEIKIVSPSGDVRTISVWSTGQIAVE